MNFDIIASKYTHANLTVEELVKRAKKISIIIRFNQTAYFVDSKQILNCLDTENNNNFIFVNSEYLVNSNSRVNFDDIESFNIIRTENDDIVKFSLNEYRIDTKKLLSKIPDELVDVTCAIEILLPFNFATPKREVQRNDECFIFLYRLAPSSIQRVNLIFQSLNRLLPLRKVDLKNISFVKGLVTNSKCHIIPRYDYFTEKSRVLDHINIASKMYIPEKKYILVQDGIQLKDYENIDFSKQLLMMFYSQDRKQIPVYTIYYYIPS